MTDAELLEKRRAELAKDLRKHLNPAIRGTVSTDILESMASGGKYILYNAEAVDAQMFIGTAEATHLDRLLAGWSIIRPGNVNLSDDVYRDLGIKVKSKKQIRQLINEIAEIIYGAEYSRAVAQAGFTGPYALEDGDVLKVKFDGGQVMEIPFSTDQFVNIGVATSQEIADAISRTLLSLGLKATAFVRTEDVGVNRVAIISGTTGPSSSVQVVGGKAQNVLQFEQVRPTAGNSSTQWTFSRANGGYMRATWTGGANPAVGKAKPGDYVNMYGSGFSPENVGTFEVVKTRGGRVNESYFEFINPVGIIETVTQGDNDGVMFFFPKNNTLTTKKEFTGAFQVKDKTLQVYLPAVTQVVRRDEVGAMHLQDEGAISDQLGPYIFDTDQGFSVSSTWTQLSAPAGRNTGYLLEVDDSSQFPDGIGSITLGYGTDRQEGPIPIISRPSDTTVMINPSYRFRFEHPIDEDVALNATDTPTTPDKFGRDHQAYLTDVVSGREYAKDLIDYVSATGINLVIIILYPNDIGLRKAGTLFSDKVYVWGP